MNTTYRLNRFFSIFFVVGIIMLTIVGIQFSIWASDREPPFHVVEAKAMAAKPGNHTVISAVVKRDLSRKCNVTYSRVFYDSIGTRFNLTDVPQKANAKGIDDLDVRMPNELRIGVEIPSGASKGPGAVVTFLDYECNPVHKYYPIAVVMSVNVEVL